MKWLVWDGLQWGTFDCEKSHGLVVLLTQHILERFLTELFPTSPLGNRQQKDHQRWFSTKELCLLGKHLCLRHALLFVHTNSTDHIIGLIYYKTFLIWSANELPSHFIKRPTTLHMLWSYPTLIQLCCVVLNSLLGSSKAPYHVAL